MPGGDVGVYMADALENGAGFAWEIFRRQLDVVMHRILNDLEPRYRNSDHAIRCQSSCYSCLRDYGNAAVHGVLDSRLGLDLARILAGKAPATNSRRSF